MDAVMNGKLVFGRDQIVSSSQAGKNFGEIRKRARRRSRYSYPTATPLTP